jgi:uracil DNA glycosylase
LNWSKLLLLTLEFWGLNVVWVLSFVLVLCKFSPQNSSVNNSNFDQFNDTYTIIPQDPQLKLNKKVGFSFPVCQAAMISGAMHPTSLENMNQESKD